MKNKRAIFLFLGFTMLVNALLVNGAYIFSGKFPESLMAVALTIMAFCLAYLTPHFATKDERAQKIRERAIYISYFWGIGFAVILMMIFNPITSINLAAFHVLSLFMALYTSTVFLNMVYYAKKY
ncbi:hypothetical protein [Solibacillus sp. FSL H8-0538]|uniref:hypothetical protein n=1 Tax=Solibacillus sp. FSL H8-0538 TaxID=2921400 RepID=UPI0030FAC903